MDKIAANNIPYNIRKKAMGKYQMIGIKDGCEISTIGVNFALGYIEEKEDEVLVNVDASNAYNSMDREMQYIMVKEELIDFVNFYKFLYTDKMIIDYDHNHRIKMSNGDIQGLSSSELLYASGKRRIQENTNKRMVEKFINFKINFQSDYIDDGINSMNYLMVKDYMEILKDEYKKWNIDINISKTCIVLKTNNKMIQDYIINNLGDYKYNFEGNLVYLGVPHGTDQFIEDYIEKLYIKLQKKLLHVELINDRQIKTILYRKFFTYNKVIYLLKNAKITNNWLNKMDSLYFYINKSIVMHLSYNQLIQYQLPLKQKCGGLGLRRPKFYYPATKITALSNKVELIKNFFNFQILNESQLNINNNLNNNNLGNGDNINSNIGINSGNNNISNILNVNMDIS